MKSVWRKGLDEDEYQDAVASSDWSGVRDHWYEIEVDKVTPKRVYLYGSGYLDRAALERDGWVPSATCFEAYYLTPPDNDDPKHSVADKRAAEVAGYCCVCDRYCWAAEDRVKASTVPSGVWERLVCERYVAAEDRDRDICQGCWAKATQVPPA